MKIKPYCRVYLLFLLVSFFLFKNPLIGQTYFVIPHHGNSLKLQHKNDLHLSFGGMIIQDGVSDKRNQQIQLGYAPLEFLGVGIFHSQIKNWKERGLEPIIHNSQQTGIEIGVFHKKKFKYNLNSKYSIRSLKRRGILSSFYIGYTNGKLLNNYFDRNLSQEYLDATVEMNVHKFYIQSGIHWMGKLFEFSGFAKAGKVNFYKGVIDGRTHGTEFGNFGNDFSDISKITENNIFTFLDYTFKSEFNFEYFGIYGQVTSSHIKSLNRSPIIKGDIGLVFYLEKIIRKKD